MKIFKVILMLQRINKKISKLDFFINRSFLTKYFENSFINCYFDYNDIGFLYHFDEKYRYLYQKYHGVIMPYEKINRYKYNFEVDDNLIKAKLMETIDYVYNYKLKVLKHIPFEKIQDDINYIITKEILSINEKNN
jgi:hypothetical protein